MHQIKIFKSIESDVVALEKQVNDWLAKSGVNVINIFGNIAPQSMPTNDKGVALVTGVFAPSDVLLVIQFEAP